MAARTNIYEKKHFENRFNAYKIHRMLYLEHKSMKANAIQRLDLFGSFATGTATPTSDIDFAMGSPRETLQQAFSNGIIDDDQWMQMLRSRNQLAHDYDGTFAKEKFQDIIGGYLPSFEKLKDKVEKYYIVK